MVSIEGIKNNLLMKHDNKKKTKKHIINFDINSYKQN